MSGVISGSPMSPPISWIGGKRSILQIILSRFPLEFDRYIEVFGGSGVVLFGKAQTAFEVWNDLNNDLYNFFYCVKYKHLELLQELRFLPLNSRTEFFLMRDFLEGKAFPPEDMEAEEALARRYFTEPEARELTEIMSRHCTLGDVSRAAAFFRLNRLSYGAKMTTYSLQPCDLRRFYGQIHAAHDRLCEVILENKDFENLIEQYDRPGAFFYIDPPYIDAEDIYSEVFTREDHHRLKNTLKKVKGKWMLSYNDDEFIRELYGGYEQYRFTRINNLMQRYESGARYNEILIANYDMSERGRQHEQLSIAFGENEWEESL